MPTIDYQILATAIDNALDCAVSKLLQEVDRKSIYAVGLYVNGELNGANFTANTISSSSDRLIWSPPNWKYHLFATECFELVHAELAKGWSNGFADYSIDLQATLKIYTSSLQAMRKRFFDDTDTLVGMFMGETSHRWVLASLEQINPQSVADRYLE
jgi:hypothetical protein